MAAYGIPKTPQSTNAWQFEYREVLGDHTDWSLAYLNEGHLPGHHRDGTLAQLWVRENFANARITLAAGLGPYFSYDTIEAESDRSFTDVHGLNPIVSLAATWYACNPWFMQLHLNWIQTKDDPDTIMVLIGFGYRFSNPAPLEAAREESTAQSYGHDNEITLTAGASILNSFKSQHAFAWCLEYRRNLGPYFDGTVAYLDEGDDQVMHRYGITAKCWLKREFLQEHLSLGTGAGIYVADEDIHEKASENQSDTTLHWIFSVTGSYFFLPQWDARIIWNRIITNNDLDTDVILGGIGYHF